MVERNKLVISSGPSTEVAHKRKAGTEISTISTVLAHKKPRLGPHTPFLPGIFDSEAVTITVGSGENQQDFTIHKRLLCAKSPFFEKAFNTSFMEGKTNYITFPEDDPALFEICLQYFYTSQLPVSPDKKLRSITTHLDLFLLADKLFLPDLQQKCWSYIRRHFAMRKLPSAAFIKKVCSVELAVPKLREYLVQVCGFAITFTKTGHSQWDEVLVADVGFTVEIAKDIARRRRGYADSDEAKFHPLTLDQYLSFSSDNDLVSHQDQRYVERLRRMVKNIATCLANDWYDLFFTDWRHKSPSKEDMMKAYFGQDHNVQEKDAVKCPHCFIGGAKWKGVLDPLEFHRKQSPECVFVRALDDGEQPPLAKDLGYC